MVSHLRPHEDLILLAVMAIVSVLAPIAERFALCDKHLRARDIGSPKDFSQLAQVNSSGE